MFTSVEPLNSLNTMWTSQVNPVPCWLDGVSAPSQCCFGDKGGIANCPVVGFSELSQFVVMGRAELEKEYGPGEINQSLDTSTPRNFCDTVYLLWGLVSDWSRDRPHST